MEFFLIGMSVSFPYGLFVDRMLQYGGELRAEKRGKKMEIYILIEIQSDGHTIPIMATQHKSNIEDAKHMWGELESKQDDEIWLEEFKMYLDSFEAISEMMADEEWYQALMSEYRRSQSNGYRNDSPEQN